MKEEKARRFKKKKKSWHFHSSWCHGGKNIMEQ